MKFGPWLCFLVFIPGIALGQHPVDSLLNELDDAIKNHKVYTRQKEQRIERIKNKIDAVQKNTIDEYNLNAALFEEYRPYILDSAIFYKNRNIEIADHLNAVGRLYQSKLQMAYLMASTGMYMEAVDLIKSIRRTNLPDSLLTDYYDTYRHVYSELAYYTQDNRGAQMYWDISNQYSDSLNNLLTPDDELYYSIKEADLRNAGNFEGALEIKNTSLPWLAAKPSEPTI